MILANRVRGVDVKKVRKGAMWVSGGTGRQADDTANAKALRQQGRWPARIRLWLNGGQPGEREESWSDRRVCMWGAACHVT